MPSKADKTEHALKNALAADLSFTTKSGQHHPLHGLHPYAAKFPRGLPKHFILSLSKPGETILDPTCGSGATLLEASTTGRQSVGVDIDQIATMQSMARGQQVKPADLWNAGHTAWQTAGHLLQNSNPWRQMTQDIDSPTADFIQTWFHPESRQEMAALSCAIRQTSDDAIRNILNVILSSTVLSNNGTSRATDISHSRPHLKPESAPRVPALGIFRKKLESAARAYAAAPRTGNTTVLQADARCLPLRDATADLVISSPPYANALDYMRSHKFALVWLGVSITQTSQMGREYIGTERTRAPTYQPPSSPAAQEAIAKINESNPKLATAISRYFSDLEQAAKELARVLRPNSAAVMIVAPSQIRGVLVATHIAMAQALEIAGMKHVATAERKLDRNRRVMPARNHTGNGIENRMKTEYVIGAVNPP